MSVFTDRAVQLYEGPGVPSGPWEVDGLAVKVVGTGELVAVCMSAKIAELVAAIPDLVDRDFPRYTKPGPVKSMDGPHASGG